MSATSPRLRIFLDTSALVAGIWSGARMLLRLGEAGDIEQLISPQVLTELQAALARKAPETLPLAWIRAQLRRRSRGATRAGRDPLG